MSTNCSCTFSNQGYLNYSYTVNGVKKTDGNTESNIVSTCIKTDCSCLFKNQGYVNYSYTVNGTKKTDGYAESNVVSTCIRQTIPSISRIKYVTIKNVRPGDTFDYTIIVTNTGKSILNNLRLTDPLDSDTEYILGSAKVLINTAYALITDNSTVNNLDIIVNSPIPSGASVIFIFKVQVKINATFNEDIRNKGYISSNEITTPLETNETVVNIQYANLKITKVADKGSVECGNTLTYTFTIENTGNIDAIKVVFKDNFEGEFEFDDSKIIAPVGSIIVKESQYNSVSITIPKIPAKSNVSITIPGVIKCCNK